MLRILLIVVVLTLLIAVIKRMKFPTKGDHKDSAKQSPAKMVKCNYCELYVRQKDALHSGGQYYCCNEHKRKDKESRL